MQPYWNNLKKIVQKSPSLAARCLATTNILLTLKKEDFREV